MLKITTPKYKIGDIVAVESESDKEKVLQGVIFYAEFVNYWFYGIKCNNPIKSATEPELIYSYESDCGDTQTKIISKI